MHAEQEVTGSTVPPIVERLLAGAGAAAMAGSAAFVAFFDPLTENFFPVCPLFQMTGYACPGCGLTRGFHALFHGDFVTAVDFNALIPVWAVVFGYVFVSLILLAVRGRGLPMWPMRPKFLFTMVVVLLAFGVLRNVPVYPLTFLFP